MLITFPHSNLNKITSIIFTHIETLKVPETFSAQVPFEQLQISLLGKVTSCIMTKLEVTGLVHMSIGRVMGLNFVSHMQKFVRDIQSVDSGHLHPNSMAHMIISPALKWCRLPGLQIHKHHVYHCTEQCLLGPTRHALHHVLEGTPAGIHNVVTGTYGLVMVVLVIEVWSELISAGHQEDEPLLEQSAQELQLRLGWGENVWLVAQHSASFSVLSHIP